MLKRGLHSRPSWYRIGGKRLFDVVLTVISLVAASPLMLVVGVLVRRQLGSPILFRQQRLGLCGRPFEIIKFRTMTDARDANGTLLPDHERLTDLGRVLRATSLDELPELWNVMRGEMSLVGPRPLLLRYYPYFTPQEMVRFEVRPGITGAAQISGRNELGWDSRIELDIQYVHTLSLWSDIHIMFVTFSRILMRRGLRVDPASAMLDFDEERRQGAALTCADAAHIKDVQ